jgi:T-complex protein 1 subunit alpha
MLQSNSGTLQIDGTRISGQDVRTQNVYACSMIQNIIKSSLGPQGLDKMLVDNIGDVTVTNDGATILKQLEVEHPAAKILVELAQTQDEAVGDGTTSVVILAAEILKRADVLVKNKVHPTNVIAGIKLAARKAIEYIKSDVQIKTETLGKDALINAAKTSMSSKILGSESDFFAKIVVDAVTNVKTITPSGKEKYPIKSINILKQHGQSVKQSALVDGFALNCTRASQQMPRVIKDAKIAILDINLNRARMKFGVSVVINDPDKLQGVQEREQTMIRDHIKLLLDAGANVILTTKGIDDLAMKYFVEAGAMAVRRCTKEDLRRVAKLTGGQLITSFANLEGEESFDAESLGYAAEVAEETLAGDDLIFIRGAKTKSCQSIVLRGANEFLLDEMHRSLHDSICVVKRVLESKHVVPGGGAVEAGLSIFLERFATTIETREQLAIAEFAEALLVIPKTLAVNAACDATDLVAKLRAYHNEAQEDSKKKSYSRYGLDLMDGRIRDNVEHGVLEPSMIKIKYIQFATEAAITILRIDDLIRINPKKEEGGQRPY